MADFDSMVTAWSFIQNIYEATECPSVQAKICLMPLMLLDSCKITDGYYVKLLCNHKKIELRHK